MCINGQKVRLSLHVIDYAVLCIKVFLFIGKIASVILKDNNFKVESGQEDLNLFRVAKKPTECVVFPPVKGRDYLVCVWWEFVYVLVKVLESNSSCCTLSTFLVWTVEKDQVRVHCFSKCFVVIELTMVLASGNLFVILSNFQFLFSKLLSNKNHRNVFLFRFPFE